VLVLGFVPHLLVFTLLGLVVLGGVGWLLVAGLGGAQRVGRLAVADRLDMIKIALSVVAGVGGVIALTVAYRKQKLNEAAEARADIAAFDGRFSSATDKLGAQSPAIRLAGLYALAQLADDWAGGRQTCIEVLCAYLRMPYPPEPEPDSDSREAWLREQQVRHTGWRLIGNHLRQDAAVSWCGHDFDFTGAVIDGADLHEAVFSGSTVTFTGATFRSGTVRFTEATFSSSVVDFVSATFSGARVDLGSATFSDDTVVLFNQAMVTGGTVNFGAARFSGGDVYFTNATFSGGTVNFGHATFSSGTMDFLHAGFSGGTVDFNGARFSGGTVDLRGLRDYSTPALFDDWTTPPAGLRPPDPTLQRIRGSLQRFKGATDPSPGHDQ
jgi:uncharacterized protein YjbI with pentapeptide repeats